MILIQWCWLISIARSKYVDNTRHFEYDTISQIAIFDIYILNHGWNIIDGIAVILNYCSNSLKFSFIFWVQFNADQSISRRLQKQPPEAMQRSENLYQSTMEGKYDLTTKGGQEAGSCPSKAHGAGGGRGNLPSLGQAGYPPPAGQCGDPWQPCACLAWRPHWWSFLKCNILQNLISNVYYSSHWR